MKASLRSFKNINDGRDRWVAAFRTGILYRRILNKLAHDWPTRRMRSEGSGRELGLYVWG
ncbi:MAG TPA: hypothetical protein VF544_07590 [Pyrinomonadaceae bacterium]